MPFYDYYCEANEKTVEVLHRISICFKTWGEVCEKAKIDPGDTPKNSPVIKMISGVPTVWKLKGLDKDEPTNKLIC